MSWFLIALIAPVLYAATNHIDKLLLERYFKEGGIGTLILFSALLAALTLPFLFWADPTAFSISFVHMLAFAVVGVLNVLVLLFYLIALKEEEASIVIVFYQLVPVFASVLGYFFLDEILTKLQLIAMGIIIFGTTVVAFEIDADNRFRMRKKTVIFMTLASLMWATESVIFKAVALEERIWRSLFWEHLMLFVVGICIFVFVRSYRENFLVALKRNSAQILSLNVLNESLYIVGNMSLSYAYLLAPVGLVLLTESYQSIFVFIIGLFLWLFIPHLTTEKVHASRLWQKSFAIFITVIGTYLLLIP